MFFFFFTNLYLCRLTNLNGLKKRHLQSRHGKPKDKNKPKALSVKDTNNLDEDDDDMEAYDTDNSFKEVSMYVEFKLKSNGSDYNHQGVQYIYLYKN